MGHNERATVFAGSKVGLAYGMVGSSGTRLLLGCFSLRYCHMLPEPSEISHIASDSRLFPKKLDLTGEVKI
jgi:hypothetical protein